MVRIFPTKLEMAQAAAAHARESLIDLLNAKPSVRLLAATGASQFEFLNFLTAASGIDWTRVELFHLDEYAGIGMDHPASFARYIKERIIDPAGIRRYHLIDGSHPAKEMVEQMSREIRSSPVDIAFAGIGENGHLAFNDPPADFETAEPYLLVQLDEACRKQQVGEGWFQSIEEVPKQAISISIPQLLQAHEILCVVPDARKAPAVRACLEGPVSPQAPASILRVHPNSTIYLDSQSAGMLQHIDPKPLS